jgi:uncharacterized OB-fold protein
MTAQPLPMSLEDGSYRPVPAVHDRDAPYWTGGERGELVLQRCRSCHHVIHPPVLLCPWDRSPDLEWEAMSGRATVETFTENLHPFLPGFPVPSVIAMVDVEEDPTARILTNLIDVDAADVAIGMPVEVVFQKLESNDGPDVYLPLFRPRDVAADTDPGRH